MTRHLAGSFTSRLLFVVFASALALVPLSLASGSGAPRPSNVTAQPKAGSGPIFATSKLNELDCNGQADSSSSPWSARHGSYEPYHSALRPTMNCADIRGIYGVTNRNNWGGRFYDNGLYIGHDEPDMTFNSSRAGSGNNVTWTSVLGKDPTALPSVATPGSDVSHWFELTPAPWFSMAVCDPLSYPQLPCKANSDINAPACSNPSNCTGKFPGGGGALLEMQFYPPGNPPFVDSESCDDTHWCAALTIDSLACTFQYSLCNNACEEPVNFAFIQRNGVVTGPPSPQLSNSSTQTPNKETLLMTPGDKITVHIFDAAVPGGGGQKALEVFVNDLTSHQTGFMQASAANGFTHTSMLNCGGYYFNYEPSYSSAKRGNIVPWTALQANISTEFETGHFEPCTAVSGTTIPVAGGTDTAYSTCTSPYETKPGSGDGAGHPEISDALCYPLGDTHGTLLTAPDEVAGCQANWDQNGDLDFDGSAYWSEWPTGIAPTSKLPGTFQQSPPTTNSNQYSSYFFQTDVALSESTCGFGSSNTTCHVPPPNAPGHFYPYWSLASHKSTVNKKTTTTCVIEFGNVSTGVNTFGKDAQYGTNQRLAVGYPEFEGKNITNTCTKSGV